MRGPAEKKTLLLTGASGYVGRAFLAAYGSLYRFRLFGRRPAGEGHEFVRGDLSSPEDLFQAAQGVDAVIHLAAATTGSPETTDEEYFQANTVGTFNLLEAAAKAKVRKFVYGSSVCAVGFRPSSELVLETDRCEPTDGMYGLSKYLSERLCERYAAERGMDVVCLRTAMVVPQHELHVPANPFASRWLGAVHIDDVVEAFRLAVESRDIRYGVFHIAADSPACKFDISRAKAVLGFRPKYDLSGDTRPGPLVLASRIAARVKRSLNLA